MPQLNVLKRTTRQRTGRFAATEIWSKIFQVGSDLVEDVNETEDNVDEDPDYVASSSDENEASEIRQTSCGLSNTIQPLDVSQPPRTDMTSKTGKLLWSPDA